MTFIFLDESGQFSKHSDGEYFLVGSFIISDPQYTEKKIRSWQQRKFPKKMRYQAEIKWSSSSISKSLRLKTLLFISSLDIRIRFIYLQRKNIPTEFIKKQKIKTGILYTHIIGELLDLYLPSADHDFRVFCDKRHLAEITENDFKKILTNRVLPKLPANSTIKIEMIDSTASRNIQIADWITGALAWHLEQKPLGEECFMILKNNLLGSGNELFKRYDI